jgi:hypothetical protein
MDDKHILPSEPFRSVLAIVQQAMMIILTLAVTKAPRVLLSYGTLMSLCLGSAVQMNYQKVL